ARVAKGASRSARARSVILIDLFGGPSHIDTFDPKPDAPVELRGEFKTIATALPGVRICEHLPRTARRLASFTLIRSLSHGYNSHNPYAVMTGFTGGNDREDYFSKPSNHPSMGSVCVYAGLRRADVPPYVVLPSFPGYMQGLRRAAPYGGYLGSRYNPLFSTCDLGHSLVRRPGDEYDPDIRPDGPPEPQLPSLSADVTLDAIHRRRTLLEQVEAAAARLDSPAVTALSEKQRTALELLQSPAARRAFDLGRESAATRERYGRNVTGSSLLLARRLVE